MKVIIKPIFTFLTILMFVIPTVVSAKEVANGELIYKGGQTSSYVYSDIRDAKPSNSNKYMTWAAVKVCSSTYSSGWKEDKAYKQKDRVFYCNESSHYDYYKR